jgi:hypothetical protein
LNRRSPFARARVLASLALLGAGSAGCVAPPPRSTDPEPRYEPAPAHPHWAGRPVTWSKLDDIEAWLEGEGPRRYPDQVPAAWLELAEGRLELARRESAGLSPAVLAQRLGTAEAGFQRVLECKDVTPYPRLRAEQGLAFIAELRMAAAAPASPAAKAPAPKEPALVIQKREAWNAAAAIPSRLARSTGWNRITVHHSAKDSKEIGVPTSGHVADTIRDIQTFHVRNRAWGDIGYHFLIDPTGRIWQGRLLDWQGAHAQGANNVGNIGICLLGDFLHERPDPRALESLERLVDGLCERHHIPHARVYGHRKFAPTECPGDVLMAWVARYASGATH